MAGPLLQQAVVFGDARPFCIALLSPRDVSVSDDDIEAWILKTNQRLPDYARVVHWYRLPEPIANRERAVIERKYHFEINRLYEITLEACSL